MSEVLKWEGRLARLKREADQLELRIRGDMRAVRDLLDPYADDLAELPADEAAAQAVKLAEKVLHLKEKRGLVKRIERDLGR